MKAALTVVLHVSTFYRLSLNHPDDKINWTIKDLNSFTKFPSHNKDGGPSTTSPANSFVTWETGLNLFLSISGRIIIIIIIIQMVKNVGGGSEIVIRTTVGGFKTSPVVSLTETDGIHQMLDSLYSVNVTLVTSFSVCLFSSKSTNVIIKVLRVETRVLRLLNHTSSILLFCTGL